MSKKIRKQYTGGVINEAVSERALEIIASLENSESLAKEIGEMLGDFRSWREFRDTQPTVTDSINHLKKTIAAIDNLAAQLALLPEEFKSLANRDLYHLGDANIDQLYSSTRANLSNYKLLCKRAIATLKPRPVKVGEKKKQLEHKLLAAVADLIETKTGVEKEAAAGLAAEILCLCGVHNLPATARKARAAVLAINKK